MKWPKWIKPFRFEIKVKAHTKIVKNTHKKVAKTRIKEVAVAVCGNFGGNGRGCGADGGQFEIKETHFLGRTQGISVKLATATATVSVFGQQQQTTTTPTTVVKRPSQIQRLQQYCRNHFYITTGINFLAFNLKICEIWAKVNLFV